jgi:hypothetical protein
MSPSRPTHRQPRARYLAPTLALTAAGTLLGLSLFLPYWEMSLTTAAPEKDLRLVSYLDHVEGPVDAVLTHAGRGSATQLRELSELERSLAVATATVICLLVVAATFVRNRWAALLSLPALAFPLVVVADTRRWLQPIVSGLYEGAGTEPPQGAFFGRLVLGGTVVETQPGLGLFLALAASIAVVGGLWLHRRAYKPLLDELARAAGAANGRRRGR